MEANNQTVTIAATATLENLLKENRRFEPPAELAAAANVPADAHEHAAKDRLGFWAEQAARLTWAEPHDAVLDDSDAPFFEWFTGGRLNAAYNRVDPGSED